MAPVGVLEGQMADTGSGTKTIFVNGVAVGEVPVTGELERDLEIAREFLKARNLLPEPDPIRAIEGQAVAFANAANAVYERYLKTIPAANGLSAVPFVVNSAFSIELYFKTLHLIGGAPQRGHRLLALYDALPDSIRDRIEAAAQRYALDFLGQPLGNLVLRDFVADLDNAYVEWRYQHESGGASAAKLHPTILVMKVLHEICREVHRESKGD